MKKQSSWLRPLAIGAGASAVIVPLLGSSAALASTASCGEQVTGATQVAEGVCQIVYTTHGSYTFSAPSGISKLSAIAVGAGGGSNAPAWSEVYGGGGGSVVFIDSVNTSATVAVTVGQGGMPGVAGGNSSVNTTIAQGGGGATGIAGGSSQTHAGLEYPYYGASGSGFGAVGVSIDDAINLTPRSVTGGAGVRMSSVSGTSRLFGLSTDTQVLGRGGGIGIFGFTPTLVTSSLPGSGGVANAAADVSGTSVPSNGTDGAVYLRWSNALPNTGFEGRGYLFGGIGIIALGVFAIASAAATRLLRARKN